MKFLKKLAKFFLAIIIIVIISILGLYLYARFTTKLNINIANSYYLYDNNDKLFSGTTADEWIELENMSPYIIDATIAIEDKNFYSHFGFDILRIVKALYVNITSGETKQGASTISQQYVKNLFLDFDKTWSRKIEEAWLTVRLESQYSKDEILEGYLNTINYGGIFGIENASKYYFNKSAAELTLAEASILAGIPKSPSNYSPLANPDLAKKRQLLILNAMVKNEYITEKEKNEAYNTSLTYIGKLTTSDLRTLMYFEDAVLKELKTIKEIPNSFLTTGGLKIYTTLDMEAQSAIENAMNNNINETEEAQIAAVMADPNTGAILALIGGKDYSKSQFNRATSAKRQVGSTMKPFLYYAALENGFTPSTTFTSTKTTFSLSNNTTYTPQNYGDTYPNKAISMIAALAYSDNIYAVKTHLFLGEDILVNIAKRVGLEELLPAVPSLALGSAEINIIDMIRGYSTLANEGYKVDPYLIRKVEDMNGNVIYQHQETKENVLNKSLVYILNELLNNCYASELIDYNYPTCINIAAKLTHKYAIKTGTTDTDMLIFGYNKSALLGIWMGYDDNKGVDGYLSTITKNIWADSVEKYFAGKETLWYDMPSNVVGALVDPINGELANSTSTHKKFIYYIKGTEPSSDTTSLDKLIPSIKTE